MREYDEMHKLMEYERIYDFWPLSLYTALQ